MGGGEGRREAATSASATDETRASSGSVRGLDAAGEEEAEVEGGVSMATGGGVV